MEHIKYSKTGHFRDVVSSIKHNVRFEGIDENGEVKYNNNVLPTITFNGTIKLHGSNCGVSFQGNEMWVQSRNEIITEGHYDFVEFVENHKETFHNLLDDINKIAEIKSTDIVTIFGEYAGPKINKKDAITQIANRTYFIFAVRVTTEKTEEGVEGYWVDPTKLRTSSPRIRNIYEFETFTQDIDFNEPKKVIDKLSELTESVEKLCPVGKSFGIEGPGEGIVWSGTYNGKKYMFKTKGKSHSNNKVKKVVSVDPEKLQTIDETVNYLVTENRYEQAMTETGVTLNRKDTGKLLKWIANDIVAEESDTLKANDLTWKDIASEVTNKYRKMFFERIDDDL